MTRSELAPWVATSLTLCGAWAACTLAVTVFTMTTAVTLPGFIAKTGPFLVAGLITGRLRGASTRAPRLIATLVLAIAATVGWTSFSAVSHGMGMGKALTLFAASLPVMLVASVWAYAGMFLGSRGAGTRGVARESVDDELERELDREIPSGDDDDATSGSVRRRRPRAP